VGEWLLVGLLVGLGVRALAGGAALVVDPTGGLVGLSPAALDGSPFANYRLPGVVLFSVLGAGPLLAACGLLTGRRWGRAGALAVGVALSAWVGVEAAVMGAGARLQVPNLLWALATVAVALRTHRRAGSTAGG
jgi:hypothetical protein